MNDAKIRLSAEEMRLVNEPGWILTKNSIMSKMVALMAGLSDAYRPLWDNRFSAGDDGGPLPGAPKIAKGENYKGLPYVILDYPRIFGREDVLAIRTMFWWGHYCSVTLHLKGRYKALFLAAIRHRMSVLSAAGFHVGVSEDEWRHEIADDNYLPLKGMEAAVLEKILLREDFLKFSAQTALEECGMEEKLLRLYETVIFSLGS